MSFHIYFVHYYIDTNDGEIPLFPREIEMIISLPEVMSVLLLRNIFMCHTEKN
jgi:hypothetical protein